MRNIFFFDDFILPKIITIIYWISLFGIFIAGIFTMFSTSFFLGLGIILFGSLSARIYAEIVIALFKGLEYLKTIAENSNKSDD